MRFTGYVPADDVPRWFSAADVVLDPARKVFDPPPINEEDVHKILRSVVLATPSGQLHLDGSPFDRRKSPRLILLAIKAAAKSRAERER